MTKNKKVTLKVLTPIANKLGYGKVESYYTIWGTTKTTFGRRDASMWFFSFHLSMDESKIEGIEINRTYFSVTEQVKKICDACSIEPITFDKALSILNN